VAEIERRQRAVAGELGRVDPSAVFESAKGRKFIYNTFERATCLVDMDEEPPHNMNREALGIAMQIAASLDAKVPSELETMRKAVVDGSDPSAFQRTLLVGYDGRIAVGGKSIRVPEVFLEEESCGIEHGDKEVVIYNVDRLGVPLVEIDTVPEIRTPEEAKAVAKRIGLILRVTGKVQRGIGSIRQDVNVSIRGGERVEIKGFQELESMDAVIEHEVERHVKLLEIKQLLLKRGAKAHKAVDVTEIFNGTNAKILKQSVEGGGSVFGARLEGFAGALGMEVNPDRRLGSEISDYAKMAGVGGIIHSDENLERYEFNSVELKEVHGRLGLKEGDAFMLVTGPAEIAATAIDFALRRATYAMEGIPRETRGVDSKKLISTFMRPLPGGSRMYPETDVLPIQVDHAEYEALKKGVVDPDELAKWLDSEIGNRQLSEQMLWSSYLPLFKEVLEKTKVAGSVIAPILLEKTRELKRGGVDVDSMGTDAFVRIFEIYREGGVTKAAIGEILKRAPASGPDVDRVIRENKLERISAGKLEAVLMEFGKKSKEELTREIMSKYRLNVDGEELKALLEQRK
jgi:glutamyl-tRNA(Gln) amidotransferase subunit E